MNEPLNPSLWIRIFGKLRLWIFRHALLEKRITELEQKFLKKSDMRCPKCGGFKFFVSRSLPRVLEGVKISPEEHKVHAYTHEYKCHDCEYSRLYKDGVSLTPPQ